MMEEKIDLLGMNKAELSAHCEKLGHLAFRGKQIADWLYRKGVHSIDEMTNLPGDLRDKLAQNAIVGRSEVTLESKSPDGTTKYLLKFWDGETIESVLLPYADRTSVCVSTQIGCPAGCLFCATGACGFVRNLNAGEIVDQVLTLQEKGGKRVTHVVFMGMGEPLLNMNNVMKAISLLNDEVGISARRLTISTVGIPQAIQKLADANLQITLAISLHAPNDELRRKLIPVAEKFPLSVLIPACRDYANQTKRRVTMEYLLLAGVNDSPEHASRLAGLLRGIMCHVNLIPYNEVPDKPFKRPSKEAVKAFRTALENSGVEVTQRMERGHSVSAACGQLRRRTSVE